MFSSDAKSWKLQDLSSNQCDDLTSFALIQMKFHSEGEEIGKLFLLRLCFNLDPSAAGC